MALCDNRRQCPPEIEYFGDSSRVHAGAARGDRIEHMRSRDVTHHVYYGVAGENRGCFGGDDGWYAWCGAVVREKGTTAVRLGLVVIVKITSLLVPGGRG